MNIKAVSTTEAITIYDYLGRRAWIFCGISLLFVCLQSIFQISPGVMIEQLMRTLRIDVVQVSLVSSSYFYVYLLLQLPAGLLIDRYGPIKVLIIAMLCSGLACLLLAMATSLWMVIIARILTGASAAPAMVLALYLCARWCPPQFFALAVGLVEALGLLGGGIGQFMLSTLIEHGYHWQYIFSVIAVICLAVAFLVYGLMAKLMVQQKDRTVNKFNNVMMMLKPVIKSPQVWLNGLFSALLFAVIPGWTALWLIPYIQQLYTVSVKQASCASAAVFLGTALGSPLSGYISDYLGRRKLVMAGGVGAVFVMECLLIYYPPASLAGAIGLLSLLGFFSGVYMIAFAVAGSQLPLASQGSAMGFLNMLSITVGAPLFQPLVGLLLYYCAEVSPHTGKLAYSVKDFQCALSVFPLSVLVAWGMLYFIKEERPT